VPTQFATEQHWCICGARLDVTADPDTIGVLTGFFWLYHDGPGHRPADPPIPGPIRSQRDFLARR
jgi:hypothetical protein